MDYPSLLAELNRHADPARAAPMRAYMKNHFDFLGIPKPQWMRVCKPFFKDAAKAPTDWEFVRQCWANPHRELQYCALEYLRAVQKNLTPQDIPRLQALITDKPWWDSADVLDRIVGGIALRYPEANAVLLAWSQSDNIWLRRVAIDHQLLRKKQTDTALLEQILRNNLVQTEFFINKAIGWALREHAKTDPDWVRAYAAEHRDRLSGLSRREALKNSGARRLVDG